MGKSDTSQASIERRNWGKIFNGLTQMLQTQQNQLETLVNERKLLEDRIKMQHERWIADIRLYEDHISQMKDDLLLQDMERSLQTSKSDLLTGMKQSELYLCRLKIEHSEAELEDFKSFFDDLISYRNSNPQLQDSSLRSASEPAQANGGRESGLSACGNTDEARRSKALEGEVRRLRCEYEKLASEKSLEVSALVAEKKFVWNQYNVIQDDFSSKLETKQLELERAHLKVEKLLATLEQLQSSNNEKDGVIATLRNQMGKMETDSCKLKDEISRLSHSLELQRKSMNATATPVLNPCKAGTRPSSLGGKNGTKSRSNVIVNKDASSAQPSRSANQKKRGADDISDLGTPRLFTSSFKVPKLKNELNL